MAKATFLQRAKTRLMLRGRKAVTPSAPVLRSSAVLIVSTSRNDLLKHLPASNTVAEIGVFRGGFASAILKQAKPGKFHMIDPWGKDDGDEYVATYGVTDDMQSLYDSILSRYSKHIDAGSVVVHRDYGANVAAGVKDGYFDWVYVDGMHSFEGAYGDLKAFASKIDKQGFILGHDYSNTHMGRVKKFGVIGAVKRFCEEEGWHVVMFTNEDAPSYVLTRNGNKAAEDAFVNGVLSSEGIFAIEIDSALMANFEQVARPYANGRRQLFRFGDVPASRRPYAL